LILKQIDVFVDSIYTNVGGDKGEIQELKREMKNHLLEAVSDLKSEGKTEEEAIKIAIQRFGEEQEMRSTIAQIFKAQKHFTKWILYIAIVVLLLSASTFGYILQKSVANNRQLSDIGTQVGLILKNKTVITKDMKYQIKLIADSKNYIKDVKIYNVRGINNNNTNEYFRYVDNAKPDYQYTSEIWAPKFLYHIYPNGNGDNQWYVQIDYKDLSGFVSLFLVGGVTIYWTLFSIWAIVNAYHRKRLTVGWIFAFVLLNVLGYLIYLLLGKIKQASLNSKNKVWIKKVIFLLILLVVIVLGFRVYSMVPKTVSKSLKGVEYQISHKPLTNPVSNPVTININGKVHNTFFGDRIFNGTLQVKSPHFSDFEKTKKVTIEFLPSNKGMGQLNYTKNGINMGIGGFFANKNFSEVTIREGQFKWGVTAPAKSRNEAIKLTNSLENNFDKFLHFQPLK
jgi:hypothetical protein